MNWVITYKVIGKNNIFVLKENLSFETKKGVEDWFKISYDNVVGRNFEFVNAEIEK